MMITNLSPLRIAILLAFAFTGLLLVVSSVLLLVYRARFKRARDKCLVIGPELKLTQDRLAETSATLENTTRRLDETLYRQQSLLDEAVAGIFKINRAGDVVYINSKLAELCGQSSQKVLREGLGRSIHPEDRERVRAEWDALRNRQGPVCSTFRFQRNDGATVTALCQMYAMRGSDQAVADYVGIVTDISDLHRERAALRDAERRLTGFIEETAGAFYRLTPDEPLAVANAAPEELAGQLYKSMSLASCNSAFAALYGKTAGELAGTRLDGFPDGCGPFSGPESMRPLIRNSFVLRDLEVTRRDARGNHLCLQCQAVGMVEDGRLTGIWGTLRDVSRQKREVEALNRRLQFMENIVNTLPGDVVVKDTMCRFLYVSPDMAERTGIPAEEWIGKTVFEMLPGTPRDFNRNSIDVMKTGKMKRTVGPCDTPEGTGWRETFEIPMTGSEGLVEGAVSLSLDVSDRVAAELALQKSEELFRSLMEKCPNGVILADAGSNKIRTVNPAMCDLTGYTEPELLEMRIADIHPPGARQAVVSGMDERARDGRAFEEAQPCLRKDRSVVYADIGLSAVWIDGREQMIGVYADATVRRKAETALMKRSEFHLQVIRQSPALFALMDCNGAVTSVNDRLLQKTGFAEQDLIGKPYASALVSEADRERVAGLFSPAGGDGEGDCEYRMRTRDGREILVEARIRPLFDGEDRLVSFSMVALDITKRRQLEEQMQTCCDRLKEQLERRTADLERAEAGRQEEHERFLRQTARELEELSGEHQKELAAEIRRRDELEELLQQSRNELVLCKEQLNASIEQRTQALKEEILVREKREQRLLQNESDLNRYRKELEASLQLRTRELESQAEERKTAENELRKIRREMKTLSGAQKELMTEQTEELKAQIAETKNAEERLRQQERELQQKQRDLEERIGQRTREMENEAEGRRRAEESLQQMQSELESFREQQEAVIARQTESLNAEINEYRKTEEVLRRNETVLRQRAASLESLVEERTRELEQMRQTREKAETALAQRQVEMVRLRNEVEEELAGRVRSYEQKLEGVRQEQLLLQRSEARYRRLFESSAEALLILDTETGTICRVNPAAVRLFGADDADQLRGQSLDTLAPEAQPDGDSSSRLALKHIHCAYEEQKNAFEWVYRKADGTLFCGLTSLTGMEDAGRHQVLAAIRDISAIKKDQEKMERAKREAEEISRANSRFVADMQEALSTSLSPVAEISAAIMHASNLSDDQRRQLAGIHHGCTELLEIMKYRLELNRMAVGAVRAEAVPFDLYNFIDEMNAKFSERVRRKSLFFAMSHAHDVARNIRADRRKLRAVLNTLLEYAMDRTDKGRLGVHATREELDGCRQRIRFEIAYTGRAAHDAMLHRVFSQPDLPREDQSDIAGLELGLAICRRYAQMMGGDIRFESRPGNANLLKFDIIAEFDPSAPSGLDRGGAAAADAAADDHTPVRPASGPQRREPAFSREASSPWG